MHGSEFPPLLWAHSLENTTRYVLFVFITCGNAREFSIVLFKMSFIYVISIRAVYVSVFIF